MSYFAFYFRKGKNVAQAAKKLHDVYGEEALKDRQCRNWFDKFWCSGDFSLKDKQRSSRPNKVDDDQILKSTIERHIQRLGLVEKLDIWIPHELKEIHLTKRINACDLHLKRNCLE